ncbi:MAG: leucine-rich repeat protein [Methanobrevibacter sp.]|nr:leucine-rich repeat protein [Methanobrevibacter sp.]
MNYILYDRLRTYFGNKNLYAGTNKIVMAYYNDDIVRGVEEDVYAGEYFYIESLEDNNTIRLIKDTTTLGVQTQPEKTVYVSRDLNTWTGYIYSAGTETITNSWSLNAGDKLYFKCSTNKLIGFYFYSTKGYNVNGNIMSLLKGDDFAGVTELTSGFYGNDDAFYKLFYNSSKLYNANKLVLHATTLANRCYSGMFIGCTSLTTAPKLPATTLAEYCYSGMFRECTSLTTAPALPATTLANGCYQNMFMNCTGLTTIPTNLLPATTLANNCYDSMFASCTSLVNAPALPATTLATGCYYQMFASCKSLVNAPALPATTLANSCYIAMFSGCTSLTKAPEVLPATTLAIRCYCDMFKYCESLTTAPELPATTLVEECYMSMFYYCTNINYIKCLATDISATNCIKYWVSNLPNDGVFVKNINITWPKATSSNNYTGIPSGWTVQDFN